MQIEPFSSAYLPAATELFMRGLNTLRERIPILPPAWAQPEPAQELLAGFLKPENALIALDDGQPVGYLGWWLVPDFRDTGRKGSFCPGFGHGARPEQSRRIYRELYAAAARIWGEAGCQLHSLRLLAGQESVERFWFESGFGMQLHDAIRPMRVIHAGAARGMNVRRASPGDAEALARLDDEHCRHYSQPPICMARRAGESAEALRAFLDVEPNRIWLAEAEGQAQAFIRFERASHGAAHYVQSPETIAITGAFTRPEWRGHGAAPALLDAALEEYASLGFTRMAVDYETTNPEALAFWPRYFEPVGVSLVRVPEVVSVGLTGATG